MASSRLLMTTQVEHRDMDNLFENIRQLAENLCNFSTNMRVLNDFREFCVADDDQKKFQSIVRATKTCALEYGNNVWPKVLSVIKQIRKYFTYYKDHPFDFLESNLRHMAKATGQCLDDIKNLTDEHNFVLTELKKQENQSQSLQERLEGSIKGNRKAIKKCYQQADYNEEMANTYCTFPIVGPQFASYFMGRKADCEDHARNIEIHVKMNEEFLTFIRQKLCLPLTYITDFLQKILGAFNFLEGRIDSFLATHDMARQEMKREQLFQLFELMQSKAIDIICACDLFLQNTSNVTSDLMSL